ncbi:MAG: PH domain-containing protein [Rhodanobacter sp.]|jgi:uncharacterized membrane protein YdbT with pleckstrin-like domain|nr:PH domain-containing protein [Rhodanobacter sp.]
MSYVQSNLMPNEQVTAIGKIHWAIYVSGTLFILLGIYFVSAAHGAGGGLGALLVIVGLFWLIRAWLYSFSTELAVTNKRVIAKFGLIRRSTVELLHSKVESFNVEQSILGRTLNYGTVIVHGTGGGRTPIRGIAEPLEFRKQALTAIEANRS